MVKIQAEGYKSLSPYLMAHSHLSFSSIATNILFISNKLDRILSTILHIGLFHLLFFGDFSTFTQITAFTHTYFFFFLI